MINFILVGVYILFTVVGLICYKYGANIMFDVGYKESSMNFKIHIVAILGLVLYLISFLLYMFVLPRFNLTYILPIVTAITSILIYVLAIFVLGEKVTLPKVLGGIIIMIGVFIMNFNFTK